MKWNRSFRLRGPKVVLPNICRRGWGELIPWSSDSPSRKDGASWKKPPLLDSGLDEANELDRTWVKTQSLILFILPQISPKTALLIVYAMPHDNTISLQLVISWKILTINPKLKLKNTHSQFLFKKIPFNRVYLYQSKLGNEFNLNKNDSIIN